MLLARLARAVGRRLPPRLQAAVDYYGRPGVRDSWGGPFNGQRGRQAMVRELLAAMSFAAVVETGTYRGATTEFFARHAGAPVHSVEATPRYYHYARRRLRAWADVELTLGDSRRFLAELAGRQGFPRRRVLFYLDAHWYDDLPLVDEIDIIRASFRDSVIAVDDFEVPGDPGYRFDDYGPGKRFTLELLAPLDQLGLVAFYPALASADETGERRGLLVLADPSAAAALEGVASLRRGR